MKRISIFLSVFVLIAASFTSCKKERVYSRHIFWFDKATSDSLKAVGVGLLHSLPTDYKTGGDDRWYTRADVDHWFASEPSFDEHGMLSVSIVIDEGKTKSFGYKIQALVPSGTNSYYYNEEALQHIPNLQGSFEMGHATTTYTQLIWQ